MCSGPKLIAYRAADRPLVLGRKPPFNPDKVAEPLGGNPNTQPQEEHAVDFIIRTVRQYPGQITLIPRGPLMNIALAICKDPGIVPLVKQILAIHGRQKSRGRGRAHPAPSPGWD